MREAPATRSAKSWSAAILTGGWCEGCHTVSLSLPLSANSTKTFTFTLPNWP